MISIRTSISGGVWSYIVSDLLDLADFISSILGAAAARGPEDAGGGEVEMCCFASAMPCSLSWSLSARAFASSGTTARGRWNCSWSPEPEGVGLDSMLIKRWSLFDRSCDGV